MREYTHHHRLSHRIQPLRAHMADRDISLAALAREAGVSRSHVSRLVSGAVKPSARLLAALARLLPDLDPEALFEPDRLVNSRAAT